jgi:hypothetical protein
MRFFGKWSTVGMDGFWKFAGSLGGKAGRGRAAGFGDSHFRFPGGGYVEASEAPEAVASLMA